MKNLIDKKTAQRLNSLSPESKARVVQAVAKALAIIAAKKGLVSPSPSKPTKTNVPDGEG